MIVREYDGPLTGPLRTLQQRIVACRQCPRLVEFRERKATTERRAGFREWDYWGAAVPSHGDPNARLLLVGLDGEFQRRKRVALVVNDPTAQTAGDERARDLQGLAIAFRRHETDARAFAG